MENPNNLTRNLNRGNSPESALMIARIVWFALLVSQGAYLVIGRILTPTTEVSRGFVAALQNPVGMAFLAMAVLALVSSFAIPKIMTPKAPSKTENLTEQRRAKFATFIVGAALNESVALLGLIGGFILMKNPDFGSGLIYISLAGMLLRFPATETFSE